MTRKQVSTPDTANRTVKRRTRRGEYQYMTCPKCGEQTLRRGQKSQSGKVRWICAKYVPGEVNRAYCYSTTDPNKPYSGRNSRKDADKNPQFKRKLGGVKRFVITAAQNATPVHGHFLEALKRYCEHNGAELVVIPLRYKNPTSRWTSSQVNAAYCRNRVTQKELFPAVAMVASAHKVYSSKRQQWCLSLSSHST
jgi:predicted RNA-binding Zn-ribbon protein involved in translation (DUF1610 family)